MTKKNDTLFASLRNRAKERTGFKPYTMQDETYGDINFRLRPVTMDELLHSSDAIPSLFSGMRGQNTEIDEMDEEEQTEAVLNNLKLSRAVVCMAVQIENTEDNSFMDIVDKEVDDCTADEMPVEAFDNNQIAELAAEVMGRIRFR